MGIFGGHNLNEAQVSNGGGVYFLAGEYTAKIDAVKGFKGQKGPTVAVDFVITKSDNEKRPVGSRVGTVYVLSKPFTMPNLKEFLVAASGMHPTSPANQAAIEAEDWNKVLDAVTDTSQPLKGVEVSVVAKDQKKRDGGVFTRLFFTPAGEAA